MTCRDFEQYWHEWMDRRAPEDPPLPPNWEAHAAACTRCRTAASSYQALSLAIQRLGPLPDPPAGFADRLLTRPDVQDAVRLASRLGHHTIRWVGGPLATAAAAAILLMGTWAIPRPGRLGGRPETARAPVVASQTPPSLDAALAQATSATWDLARSASAPAARVGRHVLASTTTAAPFDAAPGLHADASASRVLKSLGERLHREVRPLAGTARQAFGFLLDAAPGELEEPPPAGPPSGA